MADVRLTQEASSLMAQLQHHNAASMGFSSGPQGALGVVPSREPMPQSDGPSNAEGILDTNAAAARQPTKKEECVLPTVMTAGFSCFTWSLYAAELNL